MRRLTKEVEVRIYSWNDLEPIDRDLFTEASKVRPRAQAPYSHYKVGCAILAESVSGNRTDIFTGVNSEVNSWTQTTHAEQSAISNAITHMGTARILRVAVLGAPEDEEFLPFKRTDEFIEKLEHVCPSCGHCLQIILENCFDEKGNFDPYVILMGASDGEFYKTTIGDALPMPFLPQYLGTNYVKIAEEARKK